MSGKRKENARYLVLTAFWVDSDAESACDQTLLAVMQVDKVPHSGGIVAIEEGNVDAELRAVLRSVNLREAADS